MRAFSSLRLLPYFISHIKLASHCLFFGVIFISCLLCIKPSVAADTPVTCDVDGKHVWYFAIGRNVFEIDEPLLSAFSPDIKNAAPENSVTPPDPGQKEGCKNNPQQLDHFSVLHWPHLIPTNNSTNVNDQIEGMGINRYPYNPMNPPLIDPYILGIESNIMKCKYKKYLFRLSDGSILCESMEENLNPLIEKSGTNATLSWVFMVSGLDYLTPIGDNLVATEGAGQVGVFSRWSVDALITYGWYPERTSKINSSYLITIDKEFRLAMSSYQITNYPWPTKK